MPHSINEAEILIDNLLSYYNVSTYSDLALKIDTTQANISSWKIRNSINAIKNKCKELGIYNEIFGDFNSNIQINHSVSGGQIAQTVKGNLTKNNQNIDDIDNSTLSLFKEAYYKAKESDDIKGFRIHLMEYK
ncbi:hypothetical protein CJ672_07700 [Arcobacter cryaerophilus gv. occultus]|jgi:hypothetical protein|uniref:hypothetical protein n=1 Tax=Aliarcobacter cryaerophilus TaxID=28198 RepID=UPI000D01320E|nr:hypothetical protein [Aliarcobacter cryaerophilus]MBP6714322.1 hypothetical protein [Aliarcobacter sp.]MDD3264168.1 hypothetical protein [Candidatus Nanoarchaeia archaeon]PRM91851.1 hypothetical protein CJ672_07700 [Arcobacter cryaerophilus gv. occultus]QNK85406.1 hypothetical protein HOO31_01970 [Aliarcobacter cryaerophilus]